MHSRIPVERKWMPEGEPFSYLVDNSATLETLPRIPVLFLVGDPGSGKTDAVRAYLESLQSRTPLRNFSDVTSEEQLSNWLRECYESGTELYIDGYDEKPQSFKRRFIVNPLTQALAEERCPLVRIVSRDAHLDRSLVQDIKPLLHEPLDTEILFRLLPLDDSQVLEWVKSRLPTRFLDFLQEIEQKQLRPYLARPADLEAFIGLFSKTGALGTSPTEAWKEAIKLEVAETGPDRLDPQSDISAKVDADDRYQIAQILAVAQELCGGQGLLLGVDATTPCQGTLFTIHSLWEQVAFAFSHYTKDSFKAAVIETARSRLFEYGQDCIHFASAAKAQFLVAQYLSGCDHTEVLNLLKDRLEGKRIPERAQPIAAELAKFDGRLFDWLCQNQPDALLRGVVSDFASDRRAQLTETLLRSPESRTPGWHYGVSFRGLAHPAIGDQLRPYLRGQTGNAEEINLAIDIAEQTKCTELERELAAIATNSGADLRTRVNAAMAIFRIGPSDPECLRPLIDVPREIDPGDELFGAAMLALWPSGFTPANAFRLFREPGDAMRGYLAPLHYYTDGLADRLSLPLLEPGLEWLVDRQRQEVYGRDYFDKLAWALVKMAWENIDSANVLDLLAELAATRIERNRGSVLPFREIPVFRYSEEPIGLDAKDFMDSKVKRWKLFKSWLRLRTKRNHGMEVSWFVTEDELDDVIDLALESDADTVEILKSHIVARTYSLIREKQEGRIRDIRPQLKALGIETGVLRRGIRQFEASCERARHRHRTHDQQFNNEAHSQSLSNLLKEGDSRQFCYLLSLLSKNEEGRDAPGGMQISDWSRWKLLSGEEQVTVLRIGMDFLRNGPSAEIPKAEGRVSAPDWSGILALVLVAELDINWLKANPSVAKPWLRFLLALRPYFSVEGHPVNSLFSMFSIEDAVRIIRGEIERQCSPGFDPLHTSRFSEIWGPMTGELLARESRSWEEVPRQCLVAVLQGQRHSSLNRELRHELECANEARSAFAMRLILTYGVADVYGDVATLANAREGAFEQLWQHLWAEPRVGRDERIEAFGFAVLRKLFLRAVDEAPPELDVDFRSGPVTLEYSRQRLRDNIASCIAKDLSDEAQSFTAEWAKKRAFAWMKDVALRARHKWLEESWSPPTLESVVQLTVGTDRRFIATNEDLRRVVEEALERLRPRSQTLELYWANPVEGKAAREVSIAQNLTDLLSYELRQFVVNAEVSCHKGRTDIQIEARVKGSLGEALPLKCIIEVKKCDNDELLTAIGNQMVKKYMRNENGQSGVYLVLWLDHQSGCSPCNRQAEIRLELQRQADASGRNISVVHYHLERPNRGASRNRRASGKSSKPG